MSTQSSSVTIGPGFAGCLTLLFIALKLTGYIAWSWWWVLSPLWLGLALFLGLFVLFFLSLMLIAIVKK